MNLTSITPDYRSECSAHVENKCGYCSTDELVEIYRKFLDHSGKEVPDNDVDVIEAVKKLLNVKRESHIFKQDQFVSWYGYNKSSEIFDELFKPIGPADSTDLLSNIDIDSVLEQWSKQSRELFQKRFRHIPFQMIDFARPGNQLYDLNIDRLKDNRYDSIACVLNTDTSKGVGKHWFCVYIDLEHAGTEDDPLMVEYFNSSGNPPRMPVSRWIDKLIRDSKYEVRYLKSSRRRLQFSQTECGVWCLVYIKARLQNKSPEWFQENANDNLITEYRKHLFSDKI